MEIIEHIDEWRGSIKRWQEDHRGASTAREDYPVVVNKRAPFVPLGRALPMLNLALVTSAGAYIDGTEPFDSQAPGGDTSFREIPTLIEAADLVYAARGYDAAAVRRDINAQIPLTRLFEFEGNGIIGQLNPVFWSFCGFIPDAARLVENSLPRFVERVKRYEVQGVLLVPASRLCHQSMALAARALELAKIPTMMLAVARDVVDAVRPPRAAYYAGKYGSVAGEPEWPEHQRRVLDQAIRTLESLDQPGVYKLVVELETSVEISRGEQ